MEEVIRKSGRSTYAVWEITLACNLACNHCGSRAGDARADELSTKEALDLVHQMAEIGIKEITLIGGEAFLRPDWLQIAEEITRCGVTCTMTTGGYGISAQTAKRMKAAGIKRVSISVDGLEKNHDKLRGKPGSFKFCFRTIQYLKDVGIRVGCNTQINRLSAPELPMVYEKIRDAGADTWQIQLTVPMGNAADHTEILLQPYELLELYPMLAYLSSRGAQEGVSVQPANNIGYFGPYERLLRDHGKGDGGDWAIWSGCQAGLTTLGIEADGKIKGCPSLPSSQYTGGNIRDMRLKDIVYQTPELNINNTKGTPHATDHMWGFCKTCEFAELCGAGCHWTAHVFFDKRGNNPYCHHRALSHAKQGKRERFYLKEEAPGIPFDNGCFELIQESVETLLPENDSLRFAADKIQWPEQWLQDDPDLPELVKEQIETTLSIYSA